MITLDDWGEIHCTYTSCSREFCEGEICYAGLYQCPHNIERAKLWLAESIKDLEDFKNSAKQKYPNMDYDDEYYENLAYFESAVNKYKRFLNS